MTTQPPATVHVPAAGTYRLDPASTSIVFATRHLFGLGVVTGSFTLVSGEINIADPVTSSTLTAAASAASFTTGNARRDTDVRGPRFLDADVHPQIAFRSEKLVNADDGTWTLHGQITAHGKAAPAALTIVEVGEDDTGIRLQATTRVDRFAHGITKMRGMAARYLDLEIAGHASRT